MTNSSQAAVPTDRPARYGKQLVAHLGRKRGGEWDDAAQRGWIVLSAGRAELWCTEGVLVLRVEGEAEDDIGVLEDVVTRHLLRFGTRDELVVDWQRG